MDVKRREWSVSEARSQLSELIAQAFDEPQIIVDKKTRDEKAVVVIPLAMLQQIRELELRARSALLDGLFTEMQQCADSERRDSGVDILLPRPSTKPMIQFSGEA